MISIGDRGLNLGLSLHLHPYFEYAGRESSGECSFCKGVPKPSLLDNEVSTKISCAGSHYNFVFILVLQSS